MNTRLMYFATGDGADAEADMIAIPIHRLIAITPGSDTILVMKFLPSENMLREDANHFDYVALTITTDKHKKVTSSINDAINNDGKGLILICDKDNNVFVDADITDCTISINADDVA